MTTETGRVCLRRGEELDLRRGKCWVFDNEIAWREDLCLDGSIVDVVDSRQQFVARGFFNSRSRISVRVLTRDPAEQIDRDFFARRLADAWQRRRVLGFSNACRVVFGESDGLPGLTVDKFGDYLSFQIVSLGMEKWRDTLIALLAELFSPRGIYERSDVPVREKEGLPLRKGCILGEVPPLVQIREHDALMWADLPNGQKTGHFLDQQENRGRLKPYAPGRDMLDLCCHTGGFAIHGALYGAQSVTAVDVSRPALEMLMENARANRVADRITPVCANVFDLVRDYEAAGRRFGLVVCDPPAFAKSRQALDGAYRGYKELNLRCMALTAPGGYLVTCSCSQFMTAELFHRMLQEAAGDAGRKVCLLENLTQSRDHPADLWADMAW